MFFLHEAEVGYFQNMERGERLGVDMKLMDSISWTTTTFIALQISNSGSIKM